MSKTYKGYELMKAIADGKIKEGSKFLSSTGDTYIYHDNYGLAYLDTYTLQEGDIIGCIYALTIWLNFDFELIENEEKIDIQGIEEISIRPYKGFTDICDYLEEKGNELIKVIKQLDKENKRK